MAEVPVDEKWLLCPKHERYRRYGWQLGVAKHAN
jgi:hypothetical protein